MDDPHLEQLRRWMSPEEIALLRKELGSSHAIIERSKKVDRIVARAEQKEAIWQFLKVVGFAFVTVMGALATIKAVIPAGWWP